MSEIDDLYQRPWAVGEMPHDIDYTASEIVRYNNKGEDPDWSIYKAISRAILAERNACANIAAEYDSGHPFSKAVSEAIRRR